MKSYFLCLLTIILLTSCTNSTTDTSSTEGIDSTATINDFSTIESVDTWIASLTLNGNIVRTETEYNCEGWGGTLTTLKELDRLVVLEHFTGGEDGSVTTKFYYNQEKLVKIWSEMSMWAGDNNTTTQLSFYLKDGQPFKITQKDAKSTSEDQIAKNMEAAPIKEGTADELEVIKQLGVELKGLTPDKVQDHFCQ